VREERGDALRADQPRVEVAAGAPGRESEVRGVGLVRSDLEPGGRDAPSRGSREQTDGDRGLSVPGRGRAHDQTGLGAHQWSPDAYEVSAHVNMPAGWAQYLARADATWLPGSLVGCTAFC
jgi:hypothetical protein